MRRHFLMLAILFAWLVPSLDAAEIHPALADRMSGADPAEKIRVYAVFEGAATAEELAALTAGLDADDRRQAVVTHLKDRAAGTQAEVRAWTRSQEAKGAVDRVRVIWMGNVLALEATPGAILEMAAFPEIRSIHFDAIQVDAVDAPAPVPGSTPPPPGSRGTPLQPGLILLRAQEVWDRGITGTGVVVANIDTGVDWTHPDLNGQLWINSGEDINNDGAYTAADNNGQDDDNNGYVDDVVGYDFGNDDGNPMDNHGHGTSTGGQVVGDGTNGLRTGVAPDARMICLKPWSNGSTESWIWEAMQYAVDNGADITTSSLSYKWAFNPKPNYPMWRMMTDVEHAAGVLHTNSVGNQGGSGSYPIPYNISTPGNCPAPWLHPDQTLRGGLSSALGCGNVDAISDVIVSNSGRGPAAWEDIQATHPEYPYVMPFVYQDYPYETIPGTMGLLKPDIAAPGASTDATTIGGGYGGFGGTSSATPHTAGVLALMMSAAGGLTPADAARLLQLSAIERGDPGKDNEYGAGRIDAVRAVDAALGLLAPTVSSLSVSSAPMYEQSLLVITGTNFVAGTEVEFDGIEPVDIIIVNETTLQVTTPIYPRWDTVDVTVRTGLGQVTLPDAFEFRGDLFLNTATPRIGQNVNFVLKAAATARWGYIINTELSNCVLKGLPFQVCLDGRLAIDKRETTNVNGFGTINWVMPDDPGLIGETLYIQAGVDGNGIAPGSDWKVTNVASGGPIGN